MRRHEDNTFVGGRKEQPSIHTVLRADLQQKINPPLVAPVRIKQSLTSISGLSSQALLLLLDDADRNPKSTEAADQGKPAVISTHDQGTRRRLSRPKNAVHSCDRL